mmetsp:Transcript_18180/g.56383  ORF Transcript_18180/g.56383 Transcript_18180/m.56383 type:complete len:585 (-) Transcript_18180:17-1771(-)
MISAPSTGSELMRSSAPSATSQNSARSSCFATSTSPCLTCSRTPIRTSPPTSARSTRSGSGRRSTSSSARNSTTRSSVVRALVVRSGWRSSGSRLLREELRGDRAEHALALRPEAEVLRREVKAHRAHRGLPVVPEGGGDGCGEAVREHVVIVRLLQQHPHVGGDEVHGAAGACADNGRAARHALDEYEAERLVLRREDADVGDGVDLRQQVLRLRPEEVRAAEPKRLVRKLVVVQPVRVGAGAAHERDDARVGNVSFDGRGVPRGGLEHNIEALPIRKFSGEDDNALGRRCGRCRPRRGRRPSRRVESKRRLDLRSDLEPRREHRRQRARRALRRRAGIEDELVVPVGDDGDAAVVERREQLAEELPLRLRDGVHAIDVPGARVEHARDVAHPRQEPRREVGGLPLQLVLVHLERRPVREHHKGHARFAGGDAPRVDLGHHGRVHERVVGHEQVEGGPVGGLHLLDVRLHFREKPSAVRGELFLGHPVPSVRRHGRHGLTDRDVMLQGEDTVVAAARVAALRARRPHRVAPDAVDGAETLVVPLVQDAAAGGELAAALPVVGAEHEDLPSRFRRFTRHQVARQ